MNCIGNNTLALMLVRAGLETTHDEGKDEEEDIAEETERYWESCG